MKDNPKKIHRTTIGGQAVMEGVMMRGPQKTSLAVRNPQGEIQVEDLPGKGTKTAVSKIPIVRGVVNFVQSLTIGFSAINRSAEIALDEQSQQPDRFERWMEKHFGQSAGKILSGLSMVVGVLLALGLFVFLPYFAARGLELLCGFSAGFWFNLLEGVIRIAIFLAYLALVGLMPDIKRLFAYHGAEHKTIHCYEHGEELTVENVRRHSRLHKRCGTNFLLIVMIVSILIFSFIQTESAPLRLALRLALLPVVAGVSYEFIKLVGRYDNRFTDLICFPGLMLQKLTTAEPDDEQIAVGIAALTAVRPENSEDDKW